MNKKKQRVKYLRRVYGITLAIWEEILARQGGGCAICGKTPRNEGKNLSVDHDHKTREIRGILCTYCNHRIVGRHRDGDLLRRVAAYIEGGTGYFVPERKKKKRKRRR